MSFEDPDVGRHADVCVNVFFALCVMLAIRLPFVLNFSLTCNKSLATKPRESISMVILLSGGSNKNAFFVELILLR